MRTIAELRELSTDDLAAILLERIEPDDSEALDAIIILAVRAAMGTALEVLAGVNTEVRASGRDARDMADYARSELAKLRPA
jgi:hypothetical protein